MTDFTRQQKINDFVRQNQRAYTTTLTISLLVSNSIKTIRNCMESLQPLLAQVPSELIIVDTVGPENSDGSLAIAEKYADKVVHFKWRDDFAAARNAGLKEAHGKWFMFLDDDEWFDDVEELVAFFNDENEQKNFFALAYNQYNYTDTAGSSYKVNEVVRCSRIWKNLEFVDTVHERLSPIYSPVKYVDSFVHHYGYARNLNNHKSERNEKLLKNLLAQNPQDMHAWAQLVAGFNKDNHEEREKVIYYSQLALRNFKQITRKNTIDNVFAVSSLGYMLMCYTLEKNWDEILKLCKEYIPTIELRNYDLCILDSYAFAALYQKNSLNNLFPIFDEYLVNFMHIQQENQTLVRQYTPFLANRVSYSVLFSMANIIIKLYLENKDWSSIEQLATRLPLNDSIINSPETITLLLIACTKTNSSRILQILFDQFSQDNDLSKMNKLAKFINNFKNKLSIADLNNLNQQLTLINSSENPYVLLQQAEINQETTTGKIAWEKLQKHSLTCQPPFEDLLLICIDRQLNPNELVAGLNYDELLELVASISDKYSRKVNQIPDFITKIEKCWEKCPQRELLLMTLRRNYILSNQVLLENVKNQLKPYIQNALAFAHIFYKDELFTDKPSIFLPVEFQFALYLDKALTALDNEKQADYFALLKAALEIYHPANHLIKRLIANFDIQQKKDIQNQQEFEQLATQIKIKIRALIAGKQQQAALPLLKTLADIIPNDPEVTKLLQQIDK
ncbi:MAG: glycosyltransferase [Liquorilactobacillus ghanensis]|uniref:glycosyltransferase n=1 Tax=Liquorilactobacillus ghanensis TaxID=399370 RepID=UPI0039E9626C